MRDNKGSARISWATVVCALFALGASAALCVDTYFSTGVQGLLISTNTYAVSVPILQIRPVPVDLTNAQGGEIWRTTDRLALRADPTGTGMITGFTQAVTTNVTLSDQIANPTSNTTFSLVTTLPANSLTAGRKLRLRASGKYTAGTTAYPNLVFTGSLTGVTLATTGNVSTSSAANNAWDCTVDLVVYTAGASGTCYSKILGSASLNGSAAGGTISLTDAMKVGRDTDAIDTTVANTLALLVKVSTSDAAAVIKMEEFSVESLN